MRKRRDDDFLEVEETGFFIELKKNWLAIVIVLALLGGGYVVFGPDAAPPPPPAVSENWQAMEPPRPLRNFSLTTAAGNVNRISDYYGRPKIVMGYQLECEECRRSLVTLDMIAPELRGQVDIFPLAISTRSTPLTELIQREYDEAGITHLRPYTITQDASEGVFNRNALPFTLITDPNNMIVRYHGGAGNWNDERVMQLLSELTEVERTR